MIREWRISRFKSIAGREVLPFRPLTILAGPNSSGKSSVIQSILLIAQSLSSQVPERQLVLNGDLVKLGTFDDVHRQQATERSIGFGFVVDLDLRERRALLGGRSRGIYSWTRSMAGEPPGITVTGDITFGPSTDQRSERAHKPLQADVLEGSFVTSLWNPQEALFPEAEATSEADVIIARRDETQLEQLVSSLALSPTQSQSSAIRQGLRYSIRFSSRARKSLQRGRLEFPAIETAGDVIAVRMQHFLPAGVMWKQREIHRTIGAVIRRLSFASDAEATALIDAWSSASDPIRNKLIAVVRREADARSTELRRFLRDIRSRRADPDLMRALVQGIENEVGDPWRTAMAVVPGPLPEEQDVAFQGLHSFFSDIRYLGPLRDDPKPVYAMSGAVDPTDVGSKGQYTAAVLDVNSAMMLSFIPPQHTEPVRATLDEALRVWLQHFSMADEVTTIDEGKLGHRLLIRPTGIRSHVDLTNVGVGVSQVLPILVMALVAEPGSVLLFEQPELHLHPAVQSQLADFFIALARSGRQCVVETHSEYLINRLRLRIAESGSESKLEELAMIHFVERTTASSKFTPVNINRFGAIPDWPTGFFDQGPNESELILKASTKKRAGQPSKRPPTGQKTDG